MSSNISSGGSYAQRFTQYAFKHNNERGDGLSAYEMLDAANDTTLPDDVRQLARLFVNQNDLFLQTSQLSKDGMHGIKISPKDIELFCAQNPDTVAQLQAGASSTTSTTSGIPPSSTWDPYANSGWSQMWGNWNPQQAQSFMMYMYLMSMNTGNFNDLDMLMGPLRQLLTPSSTTTSTNTTSTTSAETTSTTDDTSV